MAELNRARRILWLGYGGLADAAKPLLHDAGYQLYAGRRNRMALPADIHGMVLDVTRPATLDVLAGQAWDAVIVTLTAAAGNAAAYRAVYVDGLANVLAALERNSTPPLLLFASSTSVYAQDDGSEVDEDSTTNPSGFSGRCMLQAEQLLQESVLPTCAIRFSGIYGGQRSNHLLRVLQQGRICPAQPAKYSNRLHVDDCARVLHHLLERHRTGLALAPVYLASDSHPAPLREVMLWLAAQHDIASASLVDDYLPGRAGNKRCIARRLTAEGFKPRYASYRQGFAF